jgi:acylglycerol lipase
VSRAAPLRALALALALLLPACAGQGPADLPLSPADDVASARPSLAADAIVAEDGARLPLRVWLPRGPVTATILALHGFNDYSNAFAGPAAAWAQHGIATYAYDQRGFGRAPDRGFWVGEWRLAQDLAIASRLVAQRHPGVPHYVLGESMGAAVVMTAATGAAGAERPEADGLILSAPAVWGRADMNVFERIALWATYHVAPGMTLSGRGLHIVPSDNVEMLRALSRDPLVIKDTRVDTINGLVNLMDSAVASAPLLRGRVLILHGAHDEIIPPAAAERMIATLPKVDESLRRVAFYRDGYHMLLRDLEAAVVLGDIASWIADPAAPLPSGADVGS